MTIIVGASGGGLIMPIYTTITSGALYMKTAKATTVAANAAGFWTEIDVSHTAAGYETVKLAAAANTTEQTILDITDAGVLTHVVAPALSGAGTMTIRVTADGTETTYISQTLGTQGRFILGQIIGTEGGVTAANGSGLGSALDAGFSITADRALLPTPTQSMGIRSAGIKFETSLKVTIQGSVNITATAQWLNACANYTLDIPTGV